MLAMDYFVLFLFFQAQCVNIPDHKDSNSFLIAEVLGVDWWTGANIRDQHENEAENDRPHVHH